MTAVTYEGVVLLRRTGAGKANAIPRLARAGRSSGRPGQAYGLCRNAANCDSPTRGSLEHPPSLSPLPSAIYSKPSHTLAKPIRITQLGPVGSQGPLKRRQGSQRQRGYKDRIRG